MTQGLTDVDTITLKYFMNSQYTVDGDGNGDGAVNGDTTCATARDTTPSMVPEPCKERITTLFNNMINETPTAETTDRLESIFRAFVDECVSMYRIIDAMPQQRSLDTIDTQDIAIHEMDKDLVKQIGTSGKRAMEEFVQYNCVSKLTDPPRIDEGDKISSYGRTTERDGLDEKKVPAKSGGKKIIKRKKKTGQTAVADKKKKKKKPRDEADDQADNQAEK